MEIDWLISWHNIKRDHTHFYTQTSQSTSNSLAKASNQITTCDLSLSSNFLGEQHKKNKKTCLSNRRGGWCVNQVWPKGYSKRKYQKIHLRVSHWTWVTVNWCSNWSQNFQQLVSYSPAWKNHYSHLETGCSCVAQNFSLTDNEDNHKLFSNI